MFTRFIRGLCAFGLALVLAAAPAMANDQQAEAKKQIEAALDKLSRGNATRDPALASEPYIKDESYVLFDLMPPGVDKGWKRLAAKNAAYTKLTEGGTTWTWTDKHIEVDRTMAYFRGIAHIDGEYKDGRSMKLDFRHTLIFRKINGEWLIVHEHASMPNPAIGLEAPKP